MKKIMFNDRYGLTEAVLSGRKTQTRRIAPKDPPLGNWKETEAKARFRVGEVVAIAQSYKDCGFCPETPLMEANGIGGYVKTQYSRGWTNKMFVRADLMRHHIRITNVRMERLQDISDEDCIKEGIEWDHKAQRFYVRYDSKTHSRMWFAETPRETYSALIDSISGKGTWETNPYVFVYDFELVK